MGKYMFVIPTLSNGGAERVVAVISKALADLGERVTVLKYYKTTGEYSVGNKVNVINISGGDRVAYDNMSYLQKVKKIRRAIKTEQPEYLIPFMYSVARCVDIATIGLSVNVIQSIRINPKLGPSSRIKRLLRDHLVYKSKCSFVQNESQKQYFKKKASDKLHVLFNPVSDDLFDVKPRYDSPQYTICSVGRLEEQKNFKLLIDAFKTAFSKDEQVVLRIYGEGSQREELQKYISGKYLSGQVYLMGRKDDISEAYGNSDLFVMSSDFEGMPNALIEAMACGLPCISTDCPTGPADLINNEKNGILVPVGNVKQMAIALQEMFQKREIARQMGEVARETIKKKCKAENIARQMIQICESIK